MIIIDVVRTDLGIIGVFGKMCMCEIMEIWNHVVGMSDCIINCSGSNVTNM